MQVYSESEQSGWKTFKSAALSVLSPADKGAGDGRVGSKGWAARGPPRGP